MKAFHQLRLAVLILVGGLTLYGWQRETTRRLKHDLTVRREASRDVQRLRGENVRMRNLLTAGDKTAPEQAKAEIAQLQEELTALEQKRQLTRSRTPPPVRPPTSPSASDRLPDKDAIRIADFQNHGQATPDATIRTLIWAVAQDNLAALKPLLYLSPDSQKKLRAMWNELPPESQARFKEPEQIVMMLLTLDMLHEEAFKIMRETTKDSGEVLVHVARFKHGRVQGEKRIPMKQGATGWQLVIQDRDIEVLPQAIAQVSLYVAPPEKR
jgi:hypothetical protein